jgi:dynein heavy chain
MFHAHRGSRSTPLQLVKLWQHECARVFHDRVVDAKEREWFMTTLSEVSE